MLFAAEHVVESVSVSFGNQQGASKALQFVFCHFAFLDLTQEVASKGLGLVYEHGGGENKDELVSLLVDTLMTGRR